MAELGEDRLHLACVAESALWLADHDPFPPALRVGQRLEQPERFPALGPRQRPGGVLVVGNCHDLGPARDERAGGLQLPSQALLGVLLVGR